MTCFCPFRLAPLSSLTPKVSLSVGAVPMQMPDLVAMLGMGAPGAGAAMATSRLDLKMSGLLSGMMGQPWLPTSMPTLLTMSAQMSSLGLPAVGSTDFADAAMAALARLASIPALPLDLGGLMSHLARLSDLAAIQQAFGVDAMTSAGVSPVQAMLNFMGGLRLPSLPAMSGCATCKMAA